MIPIIIRVPGLLGAVRSVGPGSRKPQPTARSPTAQKPINIVWTPGAGRPRRQRLRTGGQSESLNSRAPARCSRHHVGMGAPGRDRPGPLLRPLPRASSASGGRSVPEPAPAARSSLAPCLLAWRWSESNQQSESGSSHVLEPVCKFATFVLGSVRVVFEND